jgi:hypothetical protein
MYQGYQGQPQPPKRKTHKLRNTLLGVLGFIVIISVLGSLLDGGSDQAAPSADTSPAASGAPAAAKKPSAAKKATTATPKIGTPVRDGKFEFTVTGMKSASSIGNQYLKEEAQGKFLLVSVTVKNIGDRAQLFDASSQTLFDTKGREYSADGGAALYLGDAGKSFLEQINPGNVVKGIVVFDIPPGTALDRVELHDSPFSGGADVKLVK